MREKCLVEEVQGRELDSYDLINVLGLIKESDFKGVWRKYSPGGKPGAKINFFFSTESYYVEMTMESFPSLALSPKYQASPHLMQALLRRLLCRHRHSLILEKLRSYEVPIADGSQLNLSCSVGTVGVDMVVNRSPMPRNTASVSSAPGKADYPRVPRRQVLKRAEPGAGQAYSAMVTAQPLR